MKLSEFILRQRPQIYIVKIFFVLDVMDNISSIYLLFVVYFEFMKCSNFFLSFLVNWYIKFPTMNLIIFNEAFSFFILDKIFNSFKNASFIVKSNFLFFLIRIKVTKESNNFFFRNDSNISKK